MSVKEMQRPAPSDTPEPGPTKLQALEVERLVVKSPHPDSAQIELAADETGAHVAIRGSRDRRSIWLSMDGDSVSLSIFDTDLDDGDCRLRFDVYVDKDGAATLYVSGGDDTEAFQVVRRDGLRDRLGDLSAADLRALRAKHEADRQAAVEEHAIARQRDPSFGRLSIEREEVWLEELDRYIEQAEAVEQILARTPPPTAPAGSERPTLH